jgi:predicted nuclease with TOPRIM domain
MWFRKPKEQPQELNRNDLEAIRHEIRNAIAGIHLQHKKANRIVLELASSLQDCREHLKRIERALKDEAL